MNAILLGLKGLGPARLASLIAVGAAMFAMLGLLATRGGGQGRMALLYADLDPREAAQIAEALDRAHIAHDEPGAGDRVLVPGNEVARARMLLAKDGLPSGGSIGYEIFDRTDAVTASDFQQEINQTRALEGEIARSIRMLSGVRAARVHIVLPHHTPFAHDDTPPQASVVLTMAGNAHMDAQGIQAVLNLVAAAVPGLKPQGVAVIDSRGALLARAGSAAPEDAALQSAEELRRATETRLAQAIETMLEETVGVGHVRAEASVQMNFEHVRDTQENYNPDQQVVRSTQTVNDASRTTEAEKSVSVQNNLPNADAGSAGQSGSSDQRTEETTNYEIGKAVHTVLRDQPEIARISVAVMVDGTTGPGTDGKAAWHERSAEELGRIKALVQSAIGFDAKRGDAVDVVSMRFAASDDAGVDGSKTLFGLEHGDIVSLSQSGILGMVILLALLTVVRPLAIRLSTGATVSIAQNALLGDQQALATSGGAVTAALGGPGKANLLTDDSMVDMANIEGQIRASSLRKLVDLVDKHPDESLSIMRSWMNQERA